MENINNKPKLLSLIILALLFLFTVKHGNAQLESYLQTADTNTNYFTIRGKMFNYLDSLKNVMDSALYYSGAGEYKNFMKFDKVWAPRLYPDGKFYTYFKKEANFYNNLARDYRDYAEDTYWKELGPIRDSPGTAIGIGPIEFITIYDDGTTQSTQHMLAGSLPGGLFYTDNGGDTWVSGGTDAWASSGVGSAVFHPNDPDTWYASSSGNGNGGRSLWLRLHGGIYRTTNKGITWDKIAEPENVGGFWSIIYKIVIDPNDADILYVVTNHGIFKTTNLESEEPDWILLYEVGRFFDLELKPDNSNILYATGSLGPANSTADWKVFITNDKGQNWAPMEHQPYANLTMDFDVTKQAITIEVSKAKPDYLYCHVRNNLQVSLFYYDFAVGSQWQAIGYHLDDDNFGDGHGFGVDQFAGDYLMVSFGTKLRRYNAIPPFNHTEFTPVHHDVEDVVYHPYLHNISFVATHGGVEKATPDGGSLVFEPKYEGLGVGNVERMATSFTNPGYIIAGFDHDGTKLTNGNYTPDWITDWKFVLGQDGMQPLIDHKDPRYMWASAQQGVWIFSDDSFETSGQSIGNVPPIRTMWNTTGTLHKNNPSYFYRNRFAVNTPYEEVYRSSNKGLQNGENVYISDFGDTYGGDNKSTFVNRIATSYSDPDKLLAHVIERYTEGNTTDDTHHLWRNTAPLALRQQAINSWEVLQIPSPRGIADIAFHPDNANLVYLLYSLTGGNTYADYAADQLYLIDYTNPSPPTYTNITKTNFPNGKAGSLAIMSGQLGEIFVATDYGVFYTNNELDQWERVGQGLPNVTINGLEINFVNNTLRAGTYGRGVWELPLPCSTNENDLIINSNTTWNAPIRLDRSIKIAQGTTLTIGPNAYVAMPLNAKIKIEQGAHLIVDGGTISNGCDDYWGGIQVWGNINGSQHALPGQLNPQGKLTLKNGAIIENAWNAVSLWNPGAQYPYETTGGIVQASNTTFRNNKRAVEFMSYQNFNPIDITMLFGNISYFRNCTFEVNDDYMINSDFDSHITMWDVDGIKLTANTFSNNMTQAEDRGYGIYTIDANYRIVPGCSQQIDPCPAPYIEPNVFSNLDAGIYATNSRTSKTIFVDTAEFIGNGYGIKLDAVNNATIIRSQFEIGTFTKQDFACSGLFGVGIDINNSNGYMIEENQFTSHSNPVTNGLIGIRVNNDLDFDVNPNDIYKNSFQALNRANLAEGKNHLVQAHQGLVYQCNSNTQNFFDFYFDNQGVAGMQGSENKASGNTFSPILIQPTADHHINNLADNHVSWYHTSGSNEEPEHFSSNVTPYLISYAHGCPSSFGGGGQEIDLIGLTAEQKQYFEEELAESHAAYTGVSSLYASLLDSGNTEALQAGIAMAWPEDMWALRAELLGLSPLLSKEVLISASDRTDVLPESIIFEVLAANPDELKKKALMEHLENKAEPLPGYMIEILESLTGNITYKTILQGQMAYYGNREYRAAGILLRNMLNDSIRDKDAIRGFMATRQNLPMDMQLVDAYLESDETADALALAAILPQLYNLTGDALAEHGRYMALKQLQAGLHNQGRNIFQLTESEKTQLEGLVAESTGLAGMQARNILAFVYGYDYCDCPAELEEGQKTKPAAAPPVHKLHEPQIVARPNPANTWVSFDYRLALTDETAVLEITDAQGRLVHRKELSGRQGQYIWDIRHMSAGMYIYTLKTGRASKTGKLAIEN